MSTALSRVVAVFVMGLTTGMSVHASVSEYFNPEDLVEADGKLKQSVRETLIQLQNLERNSPLKVSAIALFRSRIADLNSEASKAKVAYDKAVRQESDFRSVSSLRSAVVRIEKQKEELLDQLKKIIATDLSPKFEAFKKEDLFNFLKENGLKKDVTDLESELKTLKEKQEALLKDTGFAAKVTENKDALIAAQSELTKLESELVSLNAKLTPSVVPFSLLAPEAEKAAPAVKAEKGLLSSLGSAASSVWNFMTNPFGHTSSKPEATVTVAPPVDTETAVAQPEVMEPTAPTAEETKTREEIKAKEAQIAAKKKEIEEKTASNAEFEASPARRMSDEKAAEFNKNKERIATIEKSISDSRENPLAGLDLEQVLTDDTIRGQVKDLIKKAKSDKRFSSEEAQAALKSIEKALEDASSRGSEIADLNSYLEKVRAAIPAENATADEKAKAEQARLETHAELLNERNRLQAAHTELRKRMSDLQAVVRIAASLPGSESGKDAESVVDAILDRPENRKYQDFQRQIDRDLDKALERAGIDPNCVKGRLSEKSLEGLDDKTKAVLRELDEKTARSLAGLAAGMQQLQQRLALNEQKDAYLATQISAQLGAENLWKGAGANDEARRQNLSAQKAQANNLAQQSAFAAQSAELECKQATDAMNQAGTAAQEQGKELDATVVQAAKAACDKSAMMSQAAQTQAGKIVEIDAALSWGATHPENGQAKIDPNLAAQTADSMRRIADSAGAAAQGNQNANNQNTTGGGLTQNAIPPIGTSLSGTLGGSGVRSFSNRNSRSSDRGRYTTSRSGRGRSGYSGRDRGGSVRSRSVGRAQRYR